MESGSRCGGLIFFAGKQQGVELVFLRLDKFLQVSRLIKRRTLAKRACSQGRVQLNDRVAKAGAVVKIGDILGVNFGRRSLQVEVLAVPEKFGVKDGASLYRILDDQVDGQDKC